MDIQNLFEESAGYSTSGWVIFDKELNKYVAVDGELVLTVEEMNLDFELFQKGIAIGEQAAKANAVLDGFVLVPVKEIKEWYLDDSESIYREDPDWLCDISIGEVVEVEHRVSYELDQDPVFAAIQWDEENGDVGYYETFKTKAEAEKVAAHCKAMIEAQEQK